MTPVLPISKDCCFVSPGNAFITRKDCFQRKCSIRYSTPLSKSAILFSPFRTECALQTKLRTSLVAATGTGVAIKDADLADEDKEFGEFLESVPVPGETSEDSYIKSDASPTSVRTKSLSVARKSDMPSVKNEDLIPGASFTGKVRSIMPFGAFVDFGAFTDGLVHVSRLSDSFVKDVNDVVSIGQEVTVWLVEANTETGRISLAMEQQKEVNSSSDKSRSPRKSSPQSNQKRNETRKSSKFVKGQELEGTVKNLTRSGAFISLPEGEEGFLPTSEEAAEGFGNMLGGTSLQTGQEVKVRVLRFNRGQVTLTMKTEDFAAEADSLIRKGVVHTATNPFAVAFRKNTDISAFLDEQQIGKESTSEAVIDEFENDETYKVEDVIGKHEGQESTPPDASHD